MCVYIKIGSDPMTTIHQCPNELKAQIEILREEMYLTGLIHGLSSEQTIKISQKLDIYIAIHSRHINGIQRTIPVELTVQSGKILVY
jgi:hypothetical protein